MTLSILTSDTPLASYAKASKLVECLQVHEAQHRVRARSEATGSLKLILLPASTYFVGSSSLRARRTSLQAEATSLEARANDLSSLLTAKRAKAQLEKQLDRARMREELVTDELWRTRRGRARDRLEILEKEIREADRRQSADRRSAGDWLGNSIMRDRELKCSTKALSAEVK